MMRSTAIATAATALADEITAIVTEAMSDDAGSVVVIAAIARWPMSLCGESMIQCGACRLRQRGQHSGATRPVLASDDIAGSD